MFLYGSINSSAINQQEEEVKNLRGGVTFHLLKKREERFYPPTFNILLSLLLPLIWTLLLIDYFLPHTPATSTISLPFPP